jgi:hypothetical protein
MKTIATLMIAIAFMAVPTSASATRIAAEYEDKDVCRNVPGHQSLYDVTRLFAEWRLDYSTPNRRHDCVGNQGRPF